MKNLQKINNWLLCHASDKVPLTVNQKWIDNVLKEIPNYFEDDSVFITDKSKWLDYMKTNDLYNGDLYNSASTGSWSKTWLTFNQVYKLVRNSVFLFPVNIDKQLSMGFVVTQDCPYTVIDFDRKEKDNLSDDVITYQDKWIKKLNSYTERSISGRGYHVFIKGKIDSEKYPNIKGTGSAGVRTCKDSYELAKGFEVYSQDRFITVTLNSINDYPLEIQERQKELNELCSVLKSPTVITEQKDNEEYKSDLSNEDLITDLNFYIDIILQSDSCEQFTDLFNNRCNYTYENNSKKAIYNSNYRLSFPSQSEADMSLMSIVSKFTTNKQIIKTIFKISKLGERDKASRNDYLDGIINTILTTEKLSTKQNFTDFIPFDDGDSLAEIEETKKEIERKNIVNELINSKYLTSDATKLLVETSWSENEVDPSYTVEYLFADTLYACGVVDALKTDFIDISSEFIPFASDKEISYKRLLDKGYINTKNFDIKKNNVMLVPPLSSGLLYELTTYSYQSRIKPVLEVSLASIIGFLSGIVGKMWQLPTHAGLNQYMVLCARSGIGKEGLHTTKNDIIKQLKEYSETHNVSGVAGMSFDCNVERHILDEDFVSGQALIKKCASLCQTSSEDTTTNDHYVSFCNYQKEFGKKLSTMSENERDNNSQTLRSAMLSLYTGSADGDMMGGMSYSDKEKNVKGCYAPSLSIVGETTISGYAEALSPTMAKDGFLSRFITITYKGKSVPQNYDGLEIKIQPRVLQSILELCEKENSLCGLNGGKPMFVTVKLDSKAKEFSNMIENLVLEILDSIDDKEHYRQSWNRCQLKILKLAGLCAVSQNFTDPKISLQHMAWATRLVFTDIANMYDLIASGESNIVENTDKVMIETIKKHMMSFIVEPNILKLAKLSGLDKDKILLLRKNRIIPMKYLRNSLSSVKVFNKGRKSFLQNIEDMLRYMLIDGSILKVDPQTAQKKLGIRGDSYQLLDTNVDYTNAE